LTIKVSRTFSIWYGKAYSSERWESCPQNATTRSKPLIKFNIEFYEVFLDCSRSLCGQDARAPAEKFLLRKQKK